MENSACRQEAPPALAAAASYREAYERREELNVGGLNDEFGEVDPGDERRQLGMADIPDEPDVRPCAIVTATQKERDAIRKRWFEQRRAIRNAARVARMQLAQRPSAGLKWIVRERVQQGTAVPEAAEVPRGDAAEVSTQAASSQSFEQHAAVDKA